MAGRFSTGPPDSAQKKRSKDSSAVIAILERFSCILAVMRFFFKLLGGGSGDAKKCCGELTLFGLLAVAAL